MKIEKLPSGSYRVRKMYKGQSYAVTFDYKPTQKEALKALSDKLEKVRNAYTKMTFEQASAEYVDMKRNVLSPKTIKEYSEMPKRLPEWFCQICVANICQIDINRVVNELAKSKSPKTVRDYHGFISAVLGTFRPNMKIYTRLPQNVKNEPYMPSSDDVKVILKEVKGTPMEIPITLACYGMRRSEICALTLSDIDGDIVHINKALVQNENKKWVIKSTKTTDSTRDIIIPTRIADMIRKQGYVFKGHPNLISNSLSRIEKKLGIPHFSVHKLRHYFASQMSCMGIADADIMRMGGWKSDHVMKTVYRHAMIDKNEQAKKTASEKLSKVLFS